MTTCWCGAKGRLYFGADSLDDRCGGMGMLYCYCGGDFCVCHYHGEVECYGCEDCEALDDEDWDWPDEAEQVMAL